MPETDAPLVATAREHVGDALRTVAKYEDWAYEFGFLRDDTQKDYTEDEIREVFDELDLSGLSREYYESLFHASHIECSMYGFEEAVMFHFTTNASEGVFLSFDRDVDGNFDAFIADCQGVVN